MEIQKHLRKIQNLLNLIRGKLENLQDEEIEPYQARILEKINQIYVPTNENIEETRKHINNLLQLFVEMNQAVQEYIPRLININKEDIKEIEFASRKLVEEVRKLNMILKKVT